jgi:hypothetical protein
MQGDTLGVRFGPYHHSDQISACEGHPLQSHVDAAWSFSAVVVIDTLLKYRFDGVHGALNCLQPGKRA